jgi:putative ABC transport system permease protein
MGDLLRRLAYLVRQRQREDDLAEEMAFHRTMAEPARAAEGDEDASQTARRAFGSEALARDQSRDVWIAPWLRDAGQDLRFGVRLLAKDLRFTGVAILVLGLGIGVDNALFMAVNAACLRGLPIPRADRVLQISARDGQRRDLPASYRELGEMRAAAPSFAALAAHSTAIVAVGEEGRSPDRAVATYISGNGFGILGEHPILGRDFRDDDDRPGAPAVAMLGYGLWHTRYGGEPGIGGRTIRVNGAPATVVGIMAHGFKFPSYSQLWQPLASMPRIASERRTARSLVVFGRIADGSTISDVRRQLDDLAARLATDYPATNKDIGFGAVRINEKYNNRISDPQWIMFLIVGVVIVVIACANVANLLLMRANERGREIAIRASLGASRVRIVRQLLIESVALAALGGLIGGALSVAGGRLLTSLVPENQMQYWIRFTMDVRVFAALCVVCLGTALLFGLAPALQATRSDLVNPIRDSGFSGASPRAGRWSTIFLAVEFALAMMLVANMISGARAGRAAERADVGSILRTS